MRGELLLTVGQWIWWLTIAGGVYWAAMASPRGRRNDAEAASSRRMAHSAPRPPAQPVHGKAARVRNARRSAKLLGRLESKTYDAKRASFLAAWVDDSGGRALDVGSR